MSDISPLLIFAAQFKTAQFSFEPSVLDPNLKDLDTGDDIELMLDLDDDELPWKKQQKPIINTFNPNLQLSLLVKKYDTRDLNEANEAVEDANNAIIEQEISEDVNISEIIGYAIGKLKSIKIQNIKDTNDQQTLSRCIQEITASLEEELSILSEEEVEQAGKVEQLQTNPFIVFAEIAKQYGKIYPDIQKANDAVLELQKALKANNVNIPSTLGTALGKLKSIRTDFINEKIRPYLDAAIFNIINELNSYFNDMSNIDKSEVTNVMTEQDNALVYLDKIAKEYDYDAIKKANEAVKLVYKTKGTNNPSYASLIGSALGLLLLADKTEIREREVKKKIKNIIAKIKTDLANELQHLTKAERDKATKDVENVLKVHTGNPHYFTSKYLFDSKFIRNMTIRYTRELGLANTTEEGEALARKELEKITQAAEDLGKKLSRDPITIKRIIITGVLNNNLTLDQAEEYVLKNTAGETTVDQSIIDNFSHIETEDEDGNELWPETKDSFTVENIEENLPEASPDLKSKILKFGQTAISVLDGLSIDSGEIDKIEKFKDHYEELINLGREILYNVEDSGVPILEDVYLLYKTVSDIGRDFEFSEPTMQQLTGVGLGTTGNKSKETRKDRRHGEKGEALRESAREHSERVFQEGGKAPATEKALEGIKIRNADREFDNRILKQYKYYAGTLLGPKDLARATDYESLKTAYVNNIATMFKNLFNSTLSKEEKQATEQDIVTRKNNFYTSEFLPLLNIRGINPQVKETMERFYNELGDNFNLGKELAKQQMLKEEKLASTISFLEQFYKLAVN
jgi:hypothetical protein